MSTAQAPASGPPALPRPLLTESARIAEGKPKIPPFYVPERWLRDVTQHLVLKMRSCLWTAKEDDVREFFSATVGARLPDGTIEMGRDWAGRFSGQVYVRFREVQHVQRAMAQRNATLLGRPFQMQRVDPNNKSFFPPGANIFSSSGARAAYERYYADTASQPPPPKGMPAAPPPPPMREPRESLREGRDAREIRESREPRDSIRESREPRESSRGEARRRDYPPPHIREVEAPGPPAVAANVRTASAAPGSHNHVVVSLNIGAAPPEDPAKAAAAALANLPVDAALSVVSQFLSGDERLPHATRNAARFLGGLREKMLDDQQVAPKARNAHFFRSPFEAAGVLGYSLSEVERAFGTRSRDSRFWAVFQAYHTLLPLRVHEAADSATTVPAAMGLDDFLTDGAAFAERERADEGTHRRRH